MRTVLIIIAGLLLSYVMLAFYFRAPDTSQYASPSQPLMIQPSEVSSAHDHLVSRVVDFRREPPSDIQAARQRMEDLLRAEIDIEPIVVDIDGMAAEWIMAAGASADRRLLYLHGGAFRVGSPRSHRYVTSELSKRAGVAVLAIDYRMLPEVGIPEILADVRKAYRWILENGPRGPRQVTDLFVAGDSAGGNLTLSVIAWARDQGLRTANAAIAMSPITDATMSSPSWRENIGTDPFIGPALGRVASAPSVLRALMLSLQMGISVRDPQFSPLLGDLKKLPPILIQVSQAEMVLGDAQRYSNKVRAAGGESVLQVWPAMVHVFPIFGPDLPEGQQALEQSAAFLRRHMMGTVDSRASRH